MRRRHSFTESGVSAAWISIADIFIQLMFLALILVGLLGYNAYASNAKSMKLEQMIAADSEKDFILSGKVTGLDLTEGEKVTLTVDQTRFIKLDKGNVFKIDNLAAGPHSIKVSADGHLTTEYICYVSDSTFDGFEIQVVEKVLDSENASTEGVGGNDGIVIAKLTDEFVPFNTADYRLLSSGKRAIESAFTAQNATGYSVLMKLKLNPKLRVAVIGQADIRPYNAPNDNLGLSAMRAASVGNYLVDELHVNPDQVIVLGLGSVKAWLPERHENEDVDSWYYRCRRILIMYAESTDQLLNQVKEID